MEIDYRARVLKGAAALDEKRPGWEREINLTTLDIGVGGCCLTAQLSGEGDWYIGMEELDLTHGDSGSYIAHGFDAESSGAPMYEHLDRNAAIEAQQTAYAALNALWKDLITERLLARNRG